MGKYYSDLERYEYVRKFRIFDKSNVISLFLYFKHISEVIK